MAGKERVWMAFCLLIAFLNWLSLWRLLFGLGVLVLLLSGSSLLLLAKKARAIVKNRERMAKPIATQPGAVTFPGSTAKMIERASKPALLILVGAVIGGIGGYMLGQDHGARRSYTDVLVVARHDSTHYTLQPEWMKPWEMTTCSPVNWEQGQKMQFLNFKYHAACDDVDNGAFVFYSEADGRRTIFSREVLNAGN